MIIQDSTMKEFRQGLKKSKTLLLPFGTIEAHGEHLPANTDSLIIDEAVKKAAAATGAFAAPVIPYGVCTSTALHPGTLGISPDTLRALTKDIVRDAHQKGLRNFILISGHGGSIHVSAMKEAAEELLYGLEGIKIAALSIYDVIMKEAAGLVETRNDSHAGELETSIVLYLRPGLVKGRSKEEYPNFPKPFLSKGKLKYWPGAVWGNPSKADAEKGKKIFSLMVEKTIELVSAIEKLK